VLGCEQFRLELGTWIDRVAGGENVLVTRRGKPRIRLSPAA
jgi:prevent-host-death family protein